MVHILLLKIRSIVVLQLLGRVLGFIIFPILGVFFCFPVISFSHDTGANTWDGVISGNPVHQHITKEAAKIWRELPSEIAFHLAQPIDAPVDVACFANYDPGYDGIVTGSADEDQEWSPGCPLGHRYARGYLEHFWDPDEPNSGGSAAYDKGFSDDIPVFSLTGISQFASSYNKAEFFWDKGVICYYTGHDKEGNPCPVDKNYAYYWLGRIAHLLEDLTVPAHVHNVPHNWLSGQLLWTDIDPFEKYVGSIFSLIRGDLYPGQEYRCENLPGISLQQGFQWTDLHPQPTNIFVLFWYIAQKTQYYASGGGPKLERWGDSGAYRKYREHSLFFRRLLP